MSSKTTTKKKKKSPATDPPGPKPKGGGGVEVLDMEQSPRVGEVSNTTKLVVNLDRIDTVQRLATGTSQPGQADACLTLQYVLSLGGKIPGPPGTATVDDPRTVMAAIKSHKVRIQNICEQAVWLDIKRPIASAEDNSQTAAIIDICKDVTLKPMEVYNYSVDMTYGSVRNDDTTAHIYQERICTLRAYRTDQLVESLMTTEGELPVLNGNADILKVTLESEYYGDVSSTIPGNFHTVSYATEFPEVRTAGRVMGSRYARTKPIKLGPKATGYTYSAVPSMQTIEYDVSVIGTGLGFDRINSERWNKSVYILCATGSNDNEAWAPVMMEAWRDYVLMIPGAGGYVWDEDYTDCPNLAGGVAVWSAEDQGFLMWDFARGQPVLSNWGYTAQNGYGEYRYGALPAKGVINAFPVSSTVRSQVTNEEPKAVFDVAILGLSFLIQMVKLVAETAAAYQAAKDALQSRIAPVQIRQLTEKEIEMATGPPPGEEEVIKPEDVVDQDKKPVKKDGPSKVSDRDKKPLQPRKVKK